MFESLLFSLQAQGRTLGGELVDAVIGTDQVAYVTPVKCPEYPYGAVVADLKGNVLAAAKGKTKEGLAELIRLKRVPHMEGHGEERA